MPIEVPTLFTDTKLVWTVESVLSPAECKHQILKIERSELESSANQMFRHQDRVMKTNKDFAAKLFKRLEPHLPAQIGNLSLLRLNELLRFYRYRPGQRFSPHTDHWYRPNDREITLLTVLLYFNDNFAGGETKFLDPIQLTVEPKEGMAAIFQHKIMHEGCEIVSGIKYALRTDVVYGAT